MCNSNPLLLYFRSRPLNSLLVLDVALAQYSKDYGNRIYPPMINRSQSTGCPLNELYIYLFHCLVLASPSVKSFSISIPDLDKLRFASCMSNIIVKQSDVAYSKAGGISALGFEASNCKT
ncbi:hypothetical protein M5689_018629 [Euphorbia peplus]|nr:hypothetical protein M5689_018629 [Euphorbia peplus]